jgi:hypothetical protein
MVNLLEKNMRSDLENGVNLLHILRTWKKMQNLKKYSPQIVIILLILSVAYLSYDKYNTGIKLKKSIQKNESDFEDLNDIFLGLADLSSKFAINSVADDEISLPPEGYKRIGLEIIIKTYRNYSIAFGVWQIDSLYNNYKNKDSNKINLLLELNNVQNASYSVFYNDSKDIFTLPEFDFDQKYLKDNIYKFKPNQILFDKQNNKWIFISNRELNLDKNALLESERFKKTGIKTIPHYPKHLQYSIGPNIDLKPFNSYEYLKNFDSIFYYDHNKTIKLNEKIIGKRIFNIVFQPPHKRGWYKIRVYSRTNRILSFSNEYQRYPNFEAGLSNSNSNLLESYMDSLYKKIVKYNVPDYKKVVVTPHDNSSLDSFNRKLDSTMNKSKLSQYSREYKYLKSYNELVKYVLHKMNKFIDCRGYLDYNIFVLTPQMAKSEE